MRIATQEPNSTPTFAELGLTIYDSLAQHRARFLTAAELQSLLEKKLAGLTFDQPIRTRSKIIRSEICHALGYPVPPTFLKTQPRFPGQSFDVYVQKSNNLQIWNESIAPDRRYVLIKLNDGNVVTQVRVITGQQLTTLDSTGTLTKKYQAIPIADIDHSRLVSPNDTPNLMLALQQSRLDFFRGLLPIDKIFVSLAKLCGTLLDDPGADQERQRGWALHQAVSHQLGIERAFDDGALPDVRPQMLELKLQTQPTIDLGLVLPGSPDLMESFAAMRLGDVQSGGERGDEFHFDGLRYADLRYAIFTGTIVDKKIRLDHLVVTTGADFFCFFKQMAGNKINTKNQIRLPDEIWN